MGFECGVCEIELRQTKLIAACQEPNCPHRKPIEETRLFGPDAKPMSELTYREMVAAYDHDE